MQEWLESLGVTDGGLDSLIRATYTALGLRTYFTTGDFEWKLCVIIKLQFWGAGE